MPDKPLPEVAAFQVFLTGRVWVFGDTEVFPLYQRKPDYRYFIVLTQSCDLVRRNGGRCTSPHVTIAAVRPLRVAFERERRLIRGGPNGRGRLVLRIWYGSQGPVGLGLGVALTSIKRTRGGWSDSEMSW